ncbi:uncharacterized protein LOC129307756 [Prosopis cineraria]|uniref:uncharacterized protein LOC129307756 n=1 Tax=Prosopis cineraria TaxID=364024 RepID=UPI0024109CC1|nr:uncharacterized protein LOC129307756 [Prosopis cineraria]
MPPSYFPLRWESTGDQWWYASPIDWAAANGLYDLVAELLHLDSNLLIKLTSLRRIRRLETVWDDESQFDDVAKCRCHVARNLLRECETRRGHNSLIRAGYGGWLLYTAASAGDVDFVLELLRRDPFLVFGEGEYGVTDILYAAARSKNSEVFKILLDSALSPRDCCVTEAELDESGRIFKKDMMNRAIHAAARGGNWEVLKQLLGSDSDILAFRDAQGCTVLHAGAGRGQVEVVKNLLESSEIITSTDAQGNTALHVASYRGYLPVVEILIFASPESAFLTNHHGDTFLHMAAAGFKSPGFQRLDKHTELMKHVVSGKIVKMQDIINVRNNEGRTALHVAVIDNIQCDVVEMLMSVPSIDLNIRDADGMTPLDLLKRRPQSTSSEILIKQLISAGGISNYPDYLARNVLRSHLKSHGIGRSPGTSFRIPDAEIFLYTGVDNASSEINYDQASVKSNSCSGELSTCESANSPNDKSGSVKFAARRLKFFLRWPKKKEREASALKLEDDEDNFSVYSFSSRKNMENIPIPLRQRYSNFCSLPNNKRTLSVRTYLPSPSTKEKFTAGLSQGVIQVNPLLALPGPFLKSSMASLTSINEQRDGNIMGPSCSNQSIDEGTLQSSHRQGSFRKRLMNRYLSFGAQGLGVEDSNSCTISSRSYNRFSSLVA